MSDLQIDFNSHDAQDAALLREAIALAIANASLERLGGGPFGAVIARKGSTPSIVARGSNCVTRHCDPTAHAEVMAIREAGRILGTHDLSGHVLYSSCEPCPMCLTAALWARIDSIVFASGREDAAEAGFDDAYFYREVALPTAQRQVPCRQVLREEARAAFDAWRNNPNRNTY
jgi:guanine deaminase